MPKFVRVYTGADGQSVIEERDFEMQEFVDSEGAHGLSSAVVNTPGITFREYAPGYFLDFHTAPRRQYSITLLGEIEVGTPDGTVKQYGPGTVLMAEDLTGTGHSTRVISAEPRFAMIVPLSD
ncbi:MAG: hypothetical protein BZY88_15580 [SAR202 cluster bacterium Io17-Chloro-G9]|nr:MAG: hypothetical protein BZY88_15580 [SAR202 cluster bacterium Io17-Chloro-G9]